MGSILPLRASPPRMHLAVFLAGPGVFLRQKKNPPHLTFCPTGTFDSACAASCKKGLLLESSGLTAYEADSLEVFRPFSALDTGSDSRRVYLTRLCGTHRFSSNLSVLSSSQCLPDHFSCRSHSWGFTLQSFPFAGIQVTFRCLRPSCRYVLIGLQQTTVARSLSLPGHSAAFRGFLLQRGRAHGIKR